MWYHRPSAGQKWQHAATCGERPPAWQHPMTPNSQPEIFWPGTNTGCWKAGHASPQTRQGMSLPINHGLSKTAH